MLFIKISTYSLSLDTQIWYSKENLATCFKVAFLLHNYTIENIFFVGGFHFLSSNLTRGLKGGEIIAVYSFYSLSLEQFLYQAF
jgi:hypothetical protein